MNPFITAFTIQFIMITNSGAIDSFITYECVKNVFTPRKGENTGLAKFTLQFCNCMIVSADNHYILMFYFHAKTVQYIIYFGFFFFLSLHFYFHVTECWLISSKSLIWLSRLVQMCFVTFVLPCNMYDIVYSTASR